MIIVGDIGGTKTILTLLRHEPEISLLHSGVYLSPSYSSLEEIVEQFLQSAATSLKKDLLHQVRGSCFAIAGPIEAEGCRTTNLPWVISKQQLRSFLQGAEISLLNDLEAAAWALEIFPETSLFPLAPGQPVAGNRALISPGTGLGEAGIYWDGTQYHPLASEAGHCEFGPRDEIQLALCRYLHNRFGHASYERILSGSGLVLLYQFLQKVMGRAEVVSLKETGRRHPQRDQARWITQNAFNRKSLLCMETVDLFISILGAEAGNCALKWMARGGVYLGGGIPPKLLPRLQESLFLDAFRDKGRFRSLLEQIPVFLILDERATLLGAAYYWLKERSSKDSDFKSLLYKAFNAIPYSIK